jgi:hypothetical protein
MANEPDRENAGAGPATDGGQQGAPPPDSSETTQNNAGSGRQNGPGGSPPGTFGRLGEIYQHTIINQQRSGGFLIAMSFLLSTLTVRGITHAIRDKRLTFLFHNISGGRGLHIHHLVLGILGLLGVGYVDVRFRPARPRVHRGLAVLYGIAAALTLDEFALWLRLSDVYWTAEGRESVDALFVAGASSLLAVEGLSFWRALWRDIIWLLFQRDKPFPRID